jgi:hypothetical protein
VARFDLANYVDVQERINRFWQENPEGRIETQLMSLPDEFERVLFKATIYTSRDNTAPTVTGWAAEAAGSGGANQTSWHENAETSAIGRALANFGYAKDRNERPSRQEMDKANRVYSAPPVGPERPIDTRSGATNFVHELKPPPPADHETGEVTEAKPLAEKFADSVDALKERSTDRDRKRVALYALMSDRQIDDNGRHTLGLALFGRSSSKTWTDPEVERMHRWVGRHDAAMWQTVLGFIRDMAKAGNKNDEVALQAVATAIGKAGIDDDELRECYKNYRTMIREPAVAASKAASR